MLTYFQNLFKMGRGRGGGPANIHPPHHTPRVQVQSRTGEVGRGRGVGNPKFGEVTLKHYSKKKPSDKTSVILPNENRRGRKSCNRLGPSATPPPPPGVRRAGRRAGSPGRGTCPASPAPRGGTGTPPGERDSPNPSAGRQPIT